MLNGPFTFVWKLFRDESLRRTTRRHKRRPSDCLASEALESRLLLTVTDLRANQTFESVAGEQRVILEWTDTDASDDSRYEIWVDQNFPNGDRNSKVFYKPDFQAAGPEFQFALDHSLAVGDHTVYVRRHDGDVKDRWVDVSFVVDDDGDPATTPVIAAPEAAEISVIRQGQGSLAQTISEGAVAWQGRGQLYDVWVNRRNDSGRFELFTTVRNVPRNNLRYREIAEAASVNWRVAYGDIDQSSLRQLESNDYRIFVREVNGATDSEGNWVGRGNWSSGVNFAVVQIEGADAIPSNLRATDEVRPIVSWDAVPHAEAYLVNLWKGPDYQNNTPISLLVHGTSYSPTAPLNTSQHAPISLQPEEELFVRVRAIGSQGPAESLRFGNYASVIVTVSTPDHADLILPPVITGPANDFAGVNPVLRWKHSAKAVSYDIWLTSLESNQQVFYATGITSDEFHVHPQTVEMSSNLAASNDEFDFKSGLANGRYRFWVRPNNPEVSGPFRWSRAHTFVVNDQAFSEVDLTPQDLAESPLVSPNLIEPIVSNSGEQHVLITTGHVESFGASVLARYKVETDGSLTRPIQFNPQTNDSELQYPDLELGTNISGLEFYSSSVVVVLSRSSNEVRLVDIHRWQVLSTYDLRPGTGGRAPDAIGLELLDNGQVLVVFNRSDRLRVLQITAELQIVEVLVAGASESDQGFVLPDGRAMHVSGVARANGNYTLFMATPTEPGIVILDYDPVALTVSRQLDTEGNPLPNIVRNRFANPYIGGHLKTLADSTGSDHNFFLSVERNGFLTWVNTATYEHGFVDLADFLDHTSRDPDSCGYANPDDNSFDSYRIADIDESRIIVSSSRQDSTIVELQLQDGKLHAAGGEAFTSGAAAAVVPVNGVRTLYSVSAGTSGVYRQAIGPQQLEGEIGEQFLNASAPDFFLARATNNGILVQQADRQRTLVTPADNSTLSLRQIPSEFPADDGHRYKFSGGASAFYFDQVTQRQYAAVSGLRIVESGAECNSQHYLLLLDLTTTGSEELIRVFDLPELNVLYHINITDHEISILDRVGAMQTVFFDWKNPETATRSSIDFFERQGRTFGGSRSGRSVRMQDGRRVVLFDTVPDRLIGVYSANDIRSVSPVATVHTHNVGQWVNDMEVLDDDRVIYVTWDARLVVFNVSTGVVETVQPLDNEEFAVVDLYGSRELSVNGSTLTVTSPGRGTVAVFDLQFDEAAHQYSAQLTDVIEAPEAIDSVVTDNAIWVIESNRIRRYAR